MPQQGLADVEACGVWSSFEEAQLEQLWRSGTEIQDIVAALAPRTRSAVYLKVRRLGLPKRERVNGRLCIVIADVPEIHVKAERRRGKDRDCLKCRRRFFAEPGIFVCERCKQTPEWRSGSEYSVAAG